jgi:DNA-binding response OmpR family regulator
VPALQYHILIVDDEPGVLSLLRDYFEMNEYRVSTAADGAAALKHAGDKPDLIILDVNMPDMDGLAVCRKIRDFISCPILFLSARVEEADKMHGFLAGGDDYVTKPFSLDELGMRVAAHLRREERKSKAAKVWFGDDLVIDYTARLAYAGNAEIPLAKKEYDLIAFLSMHRGQVFDKEHLYECVWGYDSEGSSSVIAEHVKRIRIKFRQAGVQDYIDTVWGVGYRWKM